MIFANGTLLKQIDGCPMSEPISAVFSDTLMRKMEFDVVVLAKPLIYKCYVDDIYACRRHRPETWLLKMLMLIIKTVT